MMEDGKRRKDMEGLQNMKASHDFFPLSSDAMWQDASILEAGLLQANTRIPMQPPFVSEKGSFSTAISGAEPLSLGYNGSLRWCLANYFEHHPVKGTARRTLLLLIISHNKSTFQSRKTDFNVKITVSSPHGSADWAL